MERPKSRLAPVLIVASVLCAMLMTYVSSYLWLVEPVTLALPPGLDADPPVIVTAYHVPSPDPVIVELADKFFAPIHWLDRRLRPAVWEPSR